MTKSKHQRPGMPLTPASSTEIAALDSKGGGGGGGGEHSPPGEMCFALPPAAINNQSGNNAKEERKGFQPPSPTSPLAQPQQSRPQRSSATAAKRPAVSQEFDLPPPPTRSRKIIHMKPKLQQEQTATAQASDSKPRDSANGTATTATPSASASTATPAGSRKKQNGTTTAAGRKIARKTAHSLIERRRRSKMNEEFGTLKDMIPACKGNDMHKLAILQASIEYMKYLEQCVSDLRTANKQKADWTPSLRPWNGPSGPTETQNPLDDDEDEVDEQDADRAAAADNPASYNPTPQTSPLQVGQSPQYSSSSSSQFQGTVYTPQTFEAAPMTLPSPTLDSSRKSSWAGKTAAPPRKAADGDLDREASAALLMLNSDSRGDPRQETRQPPERKLGISVHDLISH